jgi:2-(1,2-epoxy-1,2-dihydrophenyl)acetyl-CoA isomerase
MPDLGESLEKNYNPLIRTLTTLPLPVICAVNGVAAGAGANLALACDIVLAARSASFIQAFCKIGLVPDSGGTWTLPRLVGQARAMALSMLGDKISAEQAAQWGMIWQCVDDAQLPEQALTLAQHLAAQPTQGLAYIKQAIHASYTNSLSEQLDLERDLQRLAGKTADYREGVQAFMQKRSPQFTGR